MLKRIKVETRLAAQTENGEDVIVTESAGTAVIDRDGLLLRYAEADNEGEAQLLLSDSIADLHRKGQVRSRMTFVEGRLLPMAPTIFRFSPTALRLRCRPRAASSPRNTACWPAGGRCRTISWRCAGRLWNRCTFSIL